MTLPHLPHIPDALVTLPLGIAGGTILALVVDPTILAAAIVTVLVALTASIMAILTKLAESKRAAENAALELAKIVRSVDGAASASVAKISGLEEKVTTLLALLAEEKSTASTLAATHAAVAVATAGVPAVAPPLLTCTDPAESLKAIDKNTKDTANNTAHTEAVVQNLKDTRQ